MAKELDLSESTLSRVFNFQVSPKLELIEKIENWIQAQEYRNATVKGNLKKIYSLVSEEIGSLEIKRDYPSRDMKGSEGFGDYGKENYNGLSPDEEKLYDLYGEVFDLLRKSNLLEIGGDIGSNCASDIGSNCATKTISDVSYSY